MGIVFGVTGAKEPPYNLLRNSPCEVTRYINFQYPND